MPAFLDALDLRTAVLEMAGDAGSVDIWPRMVALAESRLNSELRVRQMAKGGTVETLAGETILPSDFVEMIDIYHPVYRWQVLPQAGNYLIEGSSLRLFGADGSYSITYYAAIPTIADSLAATNWLLEDAPNVYLYSVLAEVLSRDPQAWAAADGQRERAITELKIVSNRALYGNATVIPMGPTP